ncbi:PfkB family carbohydrate kinase [Vibrio sp. TH_r3]|uniref:PfkB family carbohydrate kinase n=1 Tax=Vibrio sp. TH_r3 TaxID=3082084 RepID=UPI0029532E1F|nr:PfkB family carbohydrate kinase [Vibrio sp. TH_r3]MDV7103079.1 PfkB family carbohydrate kinase [Vibrio sp. TH_r3]
MTKREQQILDILRNEPMIAQQDLATKLGLSRSAVAGHIMNLTKKGFIQGKGYIISPDQYAVVIGGANMDLCGRSTSNLIQGDSNPGELISSAGGVARNIADNLSRLGSSVQFIGVMGDDVWGEQLKNACREAGVNVDNCLTIAGATSSSYLSIHDSDGEMQLALNDMKLIDNLSSDQLRQREGVINRASTIVLDANISPDALDYLFDIHSDTAIFVDPVSSVKAPKLLPFLDRVHTLKPNLIEAELLSGVTMQQPSDLEKITDILHNKGIKQLLISLGSKGAYSSNHQGANFISPAQTQVNNVTGAGDALMAGLAHGHLKQWQWSDTVEFALGAARLALTADNTINSTMSEKAVKRLLKETITC